MAENKTGRNFEEQDFANYLKQFETKIKSLFRDETDFNKISNNRGLPANILSQLKEFNPIAIGIPIEYGGKSGLVKHNLAMAAAASYESLALSLGYGINWALFLQPLIKYGEEETKKKVLNDFVTNSRMGGLMITEPDFGSDALRMQTSYTFADNSYHIKGKKHWAGLTGHADYWLLTARQKSSSGQYMRDIDFFVCNNNAENQKIEVEEYYDNLGLYMLPYGLNRIDVTIPNGNRLIPQSSGVTMMLDTLHRSRMEFTGMAMGFLKRMLDEALNHADERNIGGKKLADYDQVKSRLSKLQSNYTVCSAMIVHVSNRSDISIDLSACNIEANSIKSVLSDMMQESAQSLLQLVGAKGYRLSHIAGRAIVDSRPFQIFEGSNDILYNQISEAVVKNMKSLNIKNVSQYIKTYHLTQKAHDIVKKLTNFELEQQLSQRKMVEFGKAFGHIVALNFVIELSNKKFRTDLIESAIQILQEEISSLINSYQNKSDVVPIRYYNEKSNWINFA